MVMLVQEQICMGIVEQRSPAFRAALHHVQGIACSTLTKTLQREAAKDKNGCNTS
jgi:hypothetical protein